MKICNTVAIQILLSLSVGLITDTSCFLFIFCGFHKKRDIKNTIYLYRVYKKAEISCLKKQCYKKHDICVL